MNPVLRQVASLWTLMGYPATRQEWTLEQKLDAIQEAGFDGVCWAPVPGLAEGARRRGLIFVGGMASASAAEFPALLRNLKDAGASQVNVQLGSDSMPPSEALALTVELMRLAADLNLHPVIETHRGTATETPEEMYALADAYHRATRELLPVSWDFSHFAVVKHLVPEDFASRLLLRPELIQHAQHFHLRPFNGHHAQIPITNGRGEIALETTAWLPFAEAVLTCWLKKNGGSGRELFVLPELGPVEGGYALSTFPDIWEDAKVLKRRIDQLWRKLTG